jgi:hypothetical protein
MPFRHVDMSRLGDPSAQPERKQTRDEQRDHQGRKKAICLHSSPLHNQQAKAESASGGDSQCIGQAQCLRIVEVELRMGRQTSGSVMNRQRAHVKHRLLEPAMIERKADCHHSTGERCQNEQRSSEREPSIAANRSDELHVPATHATGEMKQEKDKAA